MKSVKWEYYNYTFEIIQNQKGKYIIGSFPGLRTFDSAAELAYYSSAVADVLARLISLNAIKED